MNKMFNELSKEVCKFTKNPNIRWVLVLLLIMYVFSLDQFITREGDALLNSRLAKLIPSLASIKELNSGVELIKLGLFILELTGAEESEPSPSRFSSPSSVE